MSNGMVKIRLRAGSREIEIEASRLDVDDLLANWWIADDGSETSVNEEAPEDPREELNGDTPAKKPRAKRKTASRRQSPSNNQSGAPTWNPNDLANKIKEHEQFSIVEQKIIHANKDFYNRSAFIISQSEEPLTSGQVQKVLEALQVRIGLSTISTVLSNNKRNFITASAGGNTVKYTLTARARADLEKWLLADDK